MTDDERFDEGLEALHQLSALLGGEERKDGIHFGPGSIDLGLRPPDGPTAHDRMEFFEETFEGWRFHE